MPTTPMHPRILVVEDDPAIAELITSVLEDDGYDVRWAPNGEVGLVDFEASPADLILLDMRMPVMDGWEFGYEFRRRYNHTTPIVVLTAAESAARRAREALADCFLGKPFDLRDLRRIAQRFAPVAA